MAKPCLGFPTQKAAREAIRKIVWQYNTGQEFFDPLLQRLFIERPYWCDPPGPCFTNFRWDTWYLPNGARDDRYFRGFSPSTGWVTVSFNKAIAGKRMTVAHILTNFTRERVMTITTNYREQNPYCEHCRPNRVGPVDAHHTTPLAEIIKEAMVSLTEAQKLEIMTRYMATRGIKSFWLPDDHPFTTHILRMHRQPGILVSLCKQHHNTAHGKQTRNRSEDQAVGEEAP